MSDAGPPVVPPPIPPRAPPPQRNGCLTTLMGIVGAILLLPGLCALLFAVHSVLSTRYDSSFTPLIVFGVLLGIAGIVLIRFATGGPRP